MKVLLATDGSNASKTAETLVGSIAWPSGTRIDVLRVDQFDEDEIDLSEPRFAAAEAVRRTQIDEQLAAVTQQLDPQLRPLRLAGVEVVEACHPPSIGVSANLKSGD